jgi:HlyD family secretion protein
MDRPRTEVAPIKRIRRIALVTAFVLVASAGTYGLKTLKPAAPAVERGTLWPDKVKRGTMLRDVRGTGSLVPIDFRWIPSSREGLVENINVRVGDTVSPNTIIAELSNPELIQSMEDTLLQIRVAEADLANTRAALEDSTMNHQIQIAALQNTTRLLHLQAATDEELHKKGLNSSLVLKKSQLEAETSAAQLEREEQRVAIMLRAAAAQLQAQEVRIEQYRANYYLRKRQVDELKIRAGVSGVLQQLAIERGQRIAAGTSIAKVAEPGHLKAELKIPETQAKDILLGQAASVDTHTAIVPGHVVHIDPAAIQGTVTVDVQLEGELPAGARPDLSVAGNIEIERLSNALYVGRPVTTAQPDTSIQIFKILSSGEAVRTRVRIGRVSVNSVEILQGLVEGDEVILSDMSNWDAFDRLRLN